MHKQTKGALSAVAIAVALGISMMLPAHAADNVEVTSPSVDPGAIEILDAAPAPIFTVAE